MTQEVDYAVKGCLVQDHVDHWGYNLTNQKDAIKLCEKLTHQEKRLQELSKTENQLKEVSKQLNQVINTLNILQLDIEKLKNKLEKQG